MDCTEEVWLRKKSDLTSVIFYWWINQIPSTWKSRRRYFKQLDFNSSSKKKRKYKESFFPLSRIWNLHSLSLARPASVQNNHLPGVNCDLFCWQKSEGQTIEKGTKWKPSFWYSSIWDIVMVTPLHFTYIRRQSAHSNSGQGFLGMDTGNPAADHEAEMWIAALIGTLMAAVPVALLNPSLGFRRKRSVLETSDIKQSLILSSLIYQH